MTNRKALFVRSAREFIVKHDALARFDNRRALSEDDENVELVAIE